MTKEQVNLVNEMTMLKLKNKQLKEYVRHKPDCDIEIHTVEMVEKYDIGCTCKLDNVLKED